MHDTYTHSVNHVSMEPDHTAIPITDRGFTINSSSLTILTIYDAIMHFLSPGFAQIIYVFF